MMKNSARYSVLGLLLLSAIMLTSLVPGGPIETRDFSHINPLVLGSFNIFLTTLSLTSFLFLYFVWQRQRWAFVAAGINGIAFCLVYVLDLARWFPVSPDAMPPALFAIEVLGTILSIPLTALAIGAADADGALSNGRSNNRFNHSQRDRDVSDTMAIDGASADKIEKIGLFAAIAVAALLGTGIVIFATRSAMGF